MIKIFNKKTNNSILIDEKDDGIFIKPQIYDEDPFMEISIEGFFFVNHKMNCVDCNALFNSFGTNITDWYLEYSNKEYRLDLSILGSGYKSNKIKTNISDYFTGTILKIIIDIDTVESLSVKLEELVKEERYEDCSVIRDKINNIKQNE